MISWIQTNFQKHFRTLFAVLLAVTIISFIFTIGATPGIGRAGNRIIERSFFGYNLGNAEQAGRIGRDGQISAQLKGAYQATADQIQQHALTRIAGLALADRLHLPVPSEKEVAAYIATLPVFKDAQGNFDQATYAKFADSLKNNPQFTIADANRVLRDDTRLDQLSQLIGGPGYVLPEEVQKQLTLADSSWTVNVAEWDYAAYDPALSPTDDVLKKYFEENSFRYEIGARAKLGQVEFKASEYMSAASPGEAELRAFYQANAARFPVPEDDKAKKEGKPADLSLDPAKKDAAATDNFPKVRLQVEIAMKVQAAAKLASQAANDFTVALYERKLAANSSELAAYLAATKHAVTALAPFQPESPPESLAYLGSHADQLTRLSKDRFFSDPLTGPDGYVVLLWQDTLPAYKPLFAEARDKVLADYKDNEKRKRFVEQGKVIRAALEAALKAGTPFEKAAADQKLTVKAYANFTLRQPPQDFPYAAFGTLQSLGAGQVADMVAAQDKGYFVHAAQKKLPDLTTANPRYAELRTQLMKYTSAANESAILSAMVEEELKKSGPAPR